MLGNFPLLFVAIIKFLSFFINFLLIVFCKMEVRCLIGFQEFWGKLIHALHFILCIRISLETKKRIISYCIDALQ